MKVLVVDDEQHAREAVKLLVDWSGHGFEQLLEADNGEEAKRLITEHRPELVLTDMHMPIADGKALMEWIAGHYPGTQTIVISGFSDFDYMRHTVKYGGSDYLLKPLEPDQLNEAVRKSTDLIRARKEALLRQSAHNIERNQYKPVYWDSVFTRLATEPSVNVPLAEQLGKEFGCPTGGAPCVAVVCGLNPSPVSLLKRFRGDSELLAFAVANVLNDFVRLQWQAGYAFRLAGGTDAVVMLFWDGFDRLSERLEKLQSALSRTMNAPMHFALSLPQPCPKGLRVAVQQAKEALAGRNLLDPRTLIHSYRPRSSSAAVRPHLSDVEEALRLAVVSRSEEEIASALRRWTSELQAMDKITPADVAAWEQEYRILKSKWLQSLFRGVAPAEDAPAASMEELPVVYDEEGMFLTGEMERRLIRTLSRMSEALSVRKRSERSVIAEILQYIDQHLDKDLSLFNVAGRFYLSREYISRRFKQ
ncbi:hypothetical protein BG53_15580 [Paenibacillus darwinianus]|uniref:Response regulatory domain-containing protein n=1 Tax=Paenibacillus darwinianus TaxID=1380763 RepID=A0A9W5W7E6_9BACL|nr:response regulator [Paenibacillus darwinianus]EXX89496.1 hypothetical protein BG53_15580 [Paenibacillus darwinianus]EXX91202.1 hypothetical protein CH50_14065 [Paenibacillus darwinianus]EXX92533.1 hypothetical protein BG52_10740 [Paenibacillus darwinianus]